MILDEFFKPNSTANLAEGLGDLRPTLGNKRDQGKSVRKWRKARGLGEQDMDNDNLQGARSDDEVKFFIDSEPAYYAVMDRFGDHIEFRGDDLVAPLRLWGAIQQTAGDAGGAADIAGLEDDRMGTDDELDEQGVAEGLDQLSQMFTRDQAERNEFKKLVKTKAGGDYVKGGDMYAQLKNRPRNDIFGGLDNQDRFMKMKFDFDKFTIDDWNHYWTMAQHCDNNRDFQRQALATIEKYEGQDPRPDQERSHYQSLYDRISCGTTGTQKYGTQDICNIDSVAEGSAADGSVNYTLGHTPDAEYVYHIYRDGKKEGTYHSVDQAREIMGNMKLTSPNREYKIKRGARNKMAGPVGQLPEQGMTKGHGNYAGDRPVNLGGVSMKKIQIGDTVRYIDQKAQVIDMSRDREHARITIPSSATTKTVLTSDLRQLGRGMEEGHANDGTDNTPVKLGKVEKLKTGIRHHADQSRYGGTIPDVEDHLLSADRRHKLHKAVTPDHQDTDELNELSPATLARYKTKAGAAATAADSTGDRRTGDRRFSGIVKATKKQFDQDAKQSAQAVHESRLSVMASIIKTQ